MLKALSCFLFVALFQGSVQQSVPPPLDIQAVVITSEYFKSENLCSNDDMDNSSKKNTSEKLSRLRAQMKTNNISAYVILSNDEHQSETVSDHEMRLKYISGFSGSNGIAVVTHKSAALWTDSRYFLQAEEEMDCNWTLMKMGVAETPSVEKWITSQLRPGEAASSDAKICSYEKWDAWKTYLEKNNRSMKIVLENLVDKIWTDGRPPLLKKPITVLDIKFAGMSWQEKISLIRKDMQKVGADALVLTALDEIAWTLNLRGDDIRYFPVFRSYMVIQMNKITLYVHQTQVTPEVIKHLNAKGTKSGESVMIRPYEEVWSNLAAVGKTSKKVWLPAKFSFFTGISALLYYLIPDKKIYLSPTPALVRKDYKNPVEVKGMKASHIRDGLVVCQFLSLLEDEVPKGKGNWTELKAVEVLNGLRRKQKYNVGLSFGTISAFGKNAANAHYQPTPETNAVIDTSQLFMLDSGGQYLDGTTDITRTVHYGTPKELEKDIYTRLLIGCINVATTVFKEGYTMKQLEILIRAPLYEIGLDYGHGSTHGIGSYLAVHEAFNQTYHINFFGSQEPGYYKEKQFGMRLENIVAVVKAPASKGQSIPFYTFETITMVPYERKLIKTELLERKHINWINKYHETVRKLVGEEMKRQNMKKEYQWLLRKTEPIHMKK